MRPVVVKVGGSLFDLADLGPRLKTFLAAIEAPILIVPGGGGAADAVRLLDRVHGLGDETSHWLALQACSLNGQFLATILDGLPVVAAPTNDRVAVVDLYAFARDDESRPDPLPHRWDVTSDSMAVRVAHVAGAAELLLLKSIDLNDDWPAAAQRGDVDSYFPTALQQSPTLRARPMNFRKVG